MISEGGSQLSGGQRQRIAIARAILKNTPILLLDEPTSAIDEGTEQLIQDALDRLCKGKTSITIAHRLSTIKDADRIIVLQHGRIVETGTHKQLLDMGGYMQECTQKGSADNKSTQSDKNSSKLKLNVNDINNGELKLHINNENNNKDNMKDNNNRNYNNKNSGIWQLFLRTMRTMGKRRFMYYGSILGMSITFAMFSVMEAFLMKIVVDIAQKGEWDRLISSVVIIVITGVIVLLGYRFACIRYNVEAKRIYGKLYEQVLSHEMKLPCEYYENHHSGEMLSKVSFDLGRMGDIFGSRFRRVVMPFMMVVVFLVPMFALSWQLTLCLVAVNTVLIGVTMVLTGPLKSLSKKMSESNSIMTKHITDLIQGIIQVRMFPAGRKTVDRYNEEADVYAVKSDKRNMFSSLLECANTGFDLICNLVFFWH